VGAGTPGPVLRGGPVTTSPAPEAAPPPPAVAAPRPGALRRVLRYWFPPTSDRPRRPDGLTSPPGPDTASFGFALLIAAAAAALYEFAAAGAPVPPGGDDGTWLLLSYPYVGLPFPSQGAPWTYPPASFPFLGLSVLVGGGPLVGARIFAGLTIGAMALTFYVLARSLFQLRVTALVAEAAFAIQPDFMQLYYFGGFPNMFGFAFFFLALAFGLRFLRSRRPLHLGIFWAAMTVAALSHALVAVFLVALVAIAAILLFLYRRLPREFLTTPTGIAGIVGFGLFSGAYYVGGRLAHTGAPNYLTNTSLAQSASGALLPVVLRPFYLQAGSTAVNGSGFTVTLGWALSFMGGTIAVLVGLLLFLRWVAPHLVSHRHILLASWVLSVFGVTLLCYQLDLGADYRRFAYFLYPVILLGLVLPLDLALAWLLTPEALTAPSAGVGPPGRLRLRPARFRWESGGRHKAAGLLVTFVAIGLLVSTGVYAVPAALRYEKFFTGPAHDAGFVAAMASIAHSGIPGAVYSSLETVDRWPSTLTARNVIEVRSPTGFTYTPSILVLDEQAFLALNYRYTVTNSLVAAALPGVTPGYFNATPVYALYGYGVLHQVLQVAPGGVSVTLAGKSAASVFPKGSALPQIVLPSDPTNGSFEIRWHGTGFDVDETVRAVPGTDTVTIDYTATANGTANLTALRVKVVTATSNYDTVTATSPAGFDWWTPTTGGNFTTYANVTGGGVLTNLTTSNATTGKGASVTAQSNATGSGGNRSIALGFVLSSPEASNPVYGVSGFVDALSLFDQWDARFALFWSGTNATGPAAVAFFENEYGAREFYTDGEWTVLILARSPSAST